MSIGASLYPATLVDHLERPRNRGRIEDAAGVGHDENPVCGDVMTVWLRVDDGVVTSAGFEAHGCEPTIAAGSAATELIKGKTVDVALMVSRQDIADALGGLPRIKMHCAQLAAQAVRRALKAATTLAS